MRARMDEESRLNRQLTDVRQDMEDVRREDEDALRSLRLLEEGRRRDDKRLTELQGEVLALRKRADEQRGRLDLAADSLRKVEARMIELATVESERRDSYNKFVEKQTLAEVERDRKWSEMLSRFETIERQAVELEGHLQDLHTAHRDIRRTQEAVENLTERVERRITEITEMQRLGEDRFRQEWVTFKADDQKRWTNYTLTQEEQTRETARTQTRLVERMTAIEDHVQNLQNTSR
jgi:hypothetical protein